MLNLKMGCNELHVCHRVPCILIIAADKRWYHVFFSYFCTKTFIVDTYKKCLLTSARKPAKGASNEYPQHMFSCRNKKNIDTFG